MAMVTERQISFAWLSRQKLDDEIACRKVLTLWNKYIPNYIPELFNHFEPINRNFNINDIESFVPEWKWGIFFRRRKIKPAFNASFFYKKPGDNFPIHASWTMSIKSDRIDPTPFVELLERSTVEFKVDFACLTLFGPIEGMHGRFRGTSSRERRDGPPTSFALYTQELKRGIPDLYWFTILGKPYVDMFGMERILSVPAVRVRRLGDDSVSIQLTNNILDSEDNREAFQRAREKAKEHLGIGAFMRDDGQLPSDGLLPHFSFGE